MSSVDSGVSMSCTPKAAHRNQMARKVKGLLLEYERANGGHMSYAKGIECMYRLAVAFEQGQNGWSCCDERYKLDEETRQAGLELDGMSIHRLWACMLDIAQHVYRKRTSVIGEFVTTKSRATLVLVKVLLKRYVSSATAPPDAEAPRDALSPICSIHLLMIAAFVVSMKFNFDRCGGLIPWFAVQFDLPVEHLIMAERKFMQDLDFNLRVTPEQYDSEVAEAHAAGEWFPSDDEIPRLNVAEMKSMPHDWCVQRASGKRAVRFG